MNLLKCGRGRGAGVALGALRVLRILLPVLTLAAAVHARAATQSWNADGAGEGDGTWDTGVTADWDSGVTWTDSNDALFSGTGGTVIVVNPVLTAITFSASGPYLLQSGTLTFIGTNPNLLTVNSDAAISCAVTSTTALLVTGSGALTLTGTTNVRSLDVEMSGSGTVTITNGGTVSDGGVIGENAGYGGSVIVSSTGSAWINDALYLGYSGSGDMLVTNGGTVSSIASILGANPGSSGTVTVTGAGSTWTAGGLDVGSSGTGTLMIEDGGVVTAQTVKIGPLGPGTLIISGSGSTFNTSGSLYIGGNGIGTMQITSGGTAVSDALTYIQANGSVTVSGTGSTWTNEANPLYVGHFGSPGSGLASLTMSSGGAVTTNGANVSDGAVTVTGSGSTWTDSSAVYVGNTGTGTVMITGGGAASSVDSYIGVGSTPVSNGMVTLSGKGSTWTSGLLSVGESGTGTLQINAGGAVSTGTFAYIGDAASSSGMVTVSGTGSTWAGGLFSSFSVGESGTGTMAITTGGGVSDFYGLIGANMGSTGSATVSGAGSMWTNSASLDVGDSGTGTMMISGGGTVSTNNDFDGGTIGDNDGSSGMVTVSGNGSAWTNSGFLNVGNYGAGTLLITGGGTVSDGFGGASIASNAGSSGAVTVSGTGSTWTNSAALYVGGNASGPGGSGSLLITGGGLVTAAQATVWKTGTLAFGGNGTLDGPLDVSGGTLMAAAGTSGTFTVTGALTLSSSGVFVFDLDSTNGGAGNGTDELLAASVTLDAGSQFEFNDISTDPGSLYGGTEFTAIESTGTLTGTFANLPNGSEFTAGPNTFQATYSSNSLTFTVVPEPATWAMMLAALGVISVAKLGRGSEP